MNNGMHPYQFSTFELYLMDRLEKIYNNLSKNQKKAKNGLAILELIKFKKEKENVV